MSRRHSGKPPLQAAFDNKYDPLTTVVQSGSCKVWNILGQKENNGKTKQT